MRARFVCQKRRPLCGFWQTYNEGRTNIFFAFSCKCWFICVPRYLRDCISRAWISPSFRHCLILTSSLIGIWQKFSSGLKSLAKNIHRTRIITNERKKNMWKIRRRLRTTLCKIKLALSIRFFFFFHHRLVTSRCKCIRCATLCNHERIARRFKVIFFFFYLKKLENIKTNIKAFRWLILFFILRTISAIVWRLLAFRDCF